MSDFVMENMYGIIVKRGRQSVRNHAKVQGCDAEDTFAMGRNRVSQDKELSQENEVHR